MKFLIFFHFTFFIALPVSAEQQTTLEEVYIDFLSRPDLTREQNAILAGCMVDLLTEQGRENLGNALTGYQAELAILADGQPTMHPSCMLEAIQQTR